MKVLKNHLGIWRVAALALVVPIMSVLATAQSSDSAAVSQLFKQAKVHATLAYDDAKFLDANSMSAMSWQVDIKRLERVQAHMKDLVADLGRLQTLRREASPRQNAAIDGLASLIHNVNSQLSATMWWVYENQNRFNMPPFRSRAHENMLAVEKVYQYTSKNSTYYTAELANR